MRGRRQKLQVSTFPFLAVLLCAMGSLILILLVMDRKAHRAALARAQREAAKLVEESAHGQAERDRQRQQARGEWEQKRAALHDKLSAEQIEMQLQMRKVRDQLHDIAARLHYEQDTSTELRHKAQDERSRLNAEQQLLLMLRSTSGHTTNQAKESSKTLHRMTLDLLQMEQALKDLRAARKREQHTFSVVPYHGRRGENRRPIYVECTAADVIFHPERRVLSVASFGSGAVRGEVERRIAQQRAKLVQLPGNANATPYLLLLVRPEGINTYHQLQDALKGLSLDFGYEFIDVDWVLDFPADDEMPSTQPWMRAGGPSPPPLPAVAAPPKPNVGLSASAPRSASGGIVPGGNPGFQGSTRAGNGPWTRGANLTGQGSGGGNGGTGSGNPAASAPGRPGAGFPAGNGGNRGYVFATPTGAAGGPGGNAGATGSAGASLLLGTSGAAGSAGSGSSGGTGDGFGVGRRTVGLRRGSGDNSLASLTPSLGQGDGAGLPGDGGAPTGGYQGTGAFGLRGSNSAGSDPPGIGPPRALPSGPGGDGPGQSGIGGNGSSGGGGVAGVGFASGAADSGATGLPSGDGPGLDAGGKNGGGSGSALNLSGAGSTQAGGQGSGDSSLGTQILSNINAAGQASPGGRGSGISSLGSPIPGGANSTGQGGPGAQGSGGSPTGQGASDPSAGMSSNSGGGSPGPGSPGGQGSGSSSLGSPMPGGSNSVGQGSPGAQGSGASSSGTQVQGGGSTAGQGSSDPSTGTPSAGGGTSGGPQDGAAAASGNKGGSGDRVIYIDPLTGKQIAGPRSTPQENGASPPLDEEGNPRPPRVRVIVGDGSASGESGQGTPPAMDRFAPTPVAPPSAPRRTVVPRPAWVHGGRDWTIYLECRADGLVLYPSERLFPLAQASSETSDNPLRAAIQQMIDRRQALRRPGEPPYRPQLCLLVWPENVRTFLTVYPALEALPMSKTRRNLDPGDDVRTIVTGTGP